MRRPWLMGWLVGAGTLLVLSIANTARSDPWSVRVGSHVRPDGSGTEVVAEGFALLLVLWAVVGLVAWFARSRGTRRRRRALRR